MLHEPNFERRFCNGSKAQIPFDFSFEEFRSKNKDRPKDTLREISSNGLEISVTQQIPRFSTKIQIRVATPYSPDPLLREGAGLEESASHHVLLRTP